MRTRNVGFAAVREECLSKVIPIGEGMLRRALREFIEHHHFERNHQGLANALITPCTVVRAGIARSVGAQGSGAS